MRIGTGRCATDLLGIPFLTFLAIYAPYTHYTHATPQKYFLTQVLQVLLCQIQFCDSAPQKLQTALV